MKTKVEHGMIVAGHLGGYVPGGDVDTWYPELWDWLIAEKGVRSMIDVGAGEGHTLAYFHQRGVDAIGVDGVRQPKEARVLQHDYTLGPYEPLLEYDLAWSAEFVEHVAEPFIPNYLATFARARRVLMTHAVPGQAGWHHVNCQPSEYWIAQLAGAGFKLDEHLTAKTRALAARNERPVNYYRDTGLAFYRA